LNKASARGNPSDGDRNNVVSDVSGASCPEKWRGYVFEVFIRGARGARCHARYLQCGRSTNYPLWAGSITGQGLDTTTGSSHFCSRRLVRSSRKISRKNLCQLLSRALSTIRSIRFNYERYTTSVRDLDGVMPSIGIPQITREPDRPPVPSKPDSRLSRHAHDLDGEPLQF
jgi:hypothetical protein